MIMRIVHARAKAREEVGQRSSLGPHKRSLRPSVQSETSTPQKQDMFHFDCIPKVDTADELIDITFRKASAAADKHRGTKFSKDRMARSREIEKVRITVLKDALYARLDKIFLSFPDIRLMSPFYQELAKSLIDVEQFKRSLASIKWAQGKIGDFWAFYNSKITKTMDLRAINPYRREYYGRMASVLKQIKSNLKFLEDVRRTFKQFPVIETGVPTVAIVGFPNVGKTTLLFKLTGSKPEIAPYAFTTQNINVSHYSLQGTRVQVLDTPGTLNRFERMNAIEKQAHLSMKYMADVLVYVFDPAESYPIADQIKLYHSVKEIGKPVVVYVSKEDICDAGDVKELAEKFGGITDREKLKAAVACEFKK